VWIDEGDSVFIAGQYRTISEIFNDSVKFNQSLCDSLIADTVLVVNSVFPSEEPLFVEIPNVFTPNNDGKNDVLKIKVENYSAMKVFIFNRWGEMIFEDENGTPWDGKSGSSEAPEGTYYCLVRAKELKGDEYEFSGQVTLVR